MVATTQAPLEIVQEFLLSKAKETGIELDADCEIEGFCSAYLETDGRQVLVLKKDQTTEEKVKSLACCFVFKRTPDDRKRIIRFEEDGGYFWMESIDGLRNPEIDRKADRYLSFLSFKAQKQ